ncbi:hypothetical protein [Dendronalium sp. ChiSLP03b]|uniref:hypothetical protein n=1 Tax=Dendronalium sp. ChiSLP03b TaxID=3075381 RepID=UPI002ADC4D03|nr:hypothetical protein [Dendronalium sp. ChiSLP03b]
MTFLSEGRRQEAERSAVLGFAPSGSAVRTRREPPRFRLPHQVEQLRRGRREKPVDDRVSQVDI